MTLHELYEEFLKSSGICTDTRRVEENTLFFALSGDRFDGNKFVPEALEKGCRLAVTDSKEFMDRDGAVYVSSVLGTLQQLATLHRKTKAPRILAITGSNGKTTTKELVAAVLSRQNRVLATRGNLNNHIGVPLTLLSLTDEPVAVVEMGANHPGEIGRLSEIAEPQLGLITNVGKAHLEGFGSLEGVLSAKTELYKYLHSSGGLALIDGDESGLMERAREIGVNFLEVGDSKELPVSISILRQDPFLELSLALEGKEYELKTRLVGIYNVQNIKMAAAVGLHFGIPGHEIVDAIRGYIPANQRSQFIDAGSNQVILDAYNANPTSMREAISGLLQYATLPTLLILGDMAEMGESSFNEHQELVSWIETLELERILLVGPTFCDVRRSSDRISCFLNRTDLENFLQSEPQSGYHVLVKGSRVMELEKILPLLEGHK